MELAYIETMKEHSLTYNELPDDAKIGIDQINEVLKSKRMLEKVGKSLTPRALSKIKTFDKWVKYDILDFVHDTDNNTEKAPSLDDVEKEIENKLNGDEEEKEEEDMDDDDNTQDDATTQKGLKIESELETMYANGKLSSTIEEIKGLAPTTYNHLFDTYEDGEENGVVTTRFSLIENDKKFELKQN